MDGHTQTDQVNVLGERLETCCTSPMTGWYRTGCCEVGGDDTGVHAVCAIMTDEFLAFSASVGNDLSTPVPQWRFPGLQPGDRWCLCLQRWVQAWHAGKAPRLILKATHISAIEHIPMEVLLEYALDAEDYVPDPPMED